MLNAMVQNQWVEAETHIRKLLALQGASMGLQYNLAVVLLGKEQLEEAFKILVSCTETYGESLRLCRLLGDVQYVRGERVDAIHWYSLAMQDNPQEKEHRLILMRLGLLSDEPRFSLIQEKLATLVEARSFLEKDPLKAFSLYKDLADADPTHVEALNNLGSLYLNEYKDPVAAEEKFAQVLQLVDNQGAARNLAKAKKERQV
jgi:tetratricopeptide (TPR) repeat protein